MKLGQIDGSTPNISLKADPQTHPQATFQGPQISKKEKNVAKWRALRSEGCGSLFARPGRAGPELA